VGLPLRYIQTWKEKNAAVNKGDMGIYSLKSPDTSLTQLNGFTPNMTHIEEELILRKNSLRLSIWFINSRVTSRQSFKFGK
jgi:hypothetical protein